MKEKGYATLEFMIAGSLFLGLVLFLIIYSGNEVIHHYRYSDSNIAISRSYRLFYTLFFLPGRPENWGGALSADAIGFSEGYYEINKTKFSDFIANCDSYTDYVSKIGRPFFVRVKSNSIDWSCPATSNIQTIKRTMVMNGSAVDVEVGCI